MRPQLTSKALLLLGLLGLNGCDYWPPALQGQIEALRADLNDALDERQRLDKDNTELQALQASLQREMEEKRRENETLRNRLTALTSASEQPTAPKTRFVRPLWRRRPPLTGRDVLSVQRALRRAGHRIPIDGRFGPETDVAVTRFQRKRGLEPHGIVGPHTWAALTRVR